MNFIKNLRKGTSINSGALEEALVALKKPATGVKAFDEAFGSLSLKIEGGLLKANGIPLGEIETLFRRGELIKAFDVLKKSSTLTAVDELAFRKIYKDLPDIKVKNLDDKIKIAKENHPNLNVKPANFESTLDATTKKKLETYWDKVKTTFKVGGVATGVVATIVIGASVYDSLRRATESRNGLYLMVVQNGVSKSYKITSKSCINQDAPSDGSVYTGKAIQDDNIALYLFSIIATKNETELSKVETLISKRPTLDNVKSILENVDEMMLISDYYYSRNRESFGLVANPCDVSRGQKVYTTPPCLAWNGAEARQSLEYYDVSVLPENMSLVCITNSSIIDTIMDGTEELFNSVFGSSSSTNFAKYLKYIFIAIAVVIVLSIAFFVKNKIFNKDK